LATLPALRTTLVARSVPTDRGCLLAHLPERTIMLTD
jgi:hypothetical protein